MSFLTDVFNGSKYCSTILETVGLHMPNQNFRDFCFFNVDFKVEPVIPLDALRRKMTSTVTLAYSAEVRSRRI
jgi:hypothetical protein